MKRKLFKRKKYSAYLAGRYDKKGNYVKGFWGWTGKRFEKTTSKGIDKYYYGK